MLTAANGSYSNSIIIREVDDTYIFIKNYRVIIANHLDFKTLDTVVQTNPLCNIILDGRLNNMLYYAIIRYSDNILIYNITNRRISTVYSFIADTFKVRLNQLSLNSIRLWAMILYIDSVCLNGKLNIRPNDLLKYVINNRYSSNRLTFNYMIDNINDMAQSVTINKRLLRTAHEYLLNMINAFNSKQFIIEPLRVSDINCQHIRLTLDVLYMNQCMINL